MLEKGTAMVISKPSAVITNSDRLSLQHTALFKQVPADQMKELLVHLQESIFNKGESIFNEGDTDHLSLIHI